VIPTNQREFIAPAERQNSKTLHLLYTVICTHTQTQPTRAVPIQ
jgi:hypothetical protein